jgi:uncharacterized membrane protein
MLPLVLFILCLLVFRGLGALGIENLSSWQDSSRFALAVMFLFTASAHFTKMKEDLVNMVPRLFPYPKQIVFVTGILEILGAIGIVVPTVKGLAGVCLIILLIVMFPANFNAARRKIPIRGKPPTPLWLRLPIQLAFVGLIWWATRV